MDFLSIAADMFRSETLSEWFWAAYLSIISVIIIIIIILNKRAKMNTVTRYKENQLLNKSDIFNQ